MEMFLHVQNMTKSTGACREAMTEL